jgi:hypothetical protein
VTSCRNSRLSSFAIAVALAFGAVTGTTAQAHHSFALFDVSKLTTLTGTVVDWKWANPHCWMIVDVRKADGTTEKWTVAASSPNMMDRWGWHADDFAAGDNVTVDVHPSRDGRHFGSMEAAFLANGKVLLDPGGHPGTELAAGPANVPSKPQGVPYR